MQKQNGNFLLQALLALTLVFAFMPFFANKLSSRDTEARLYSVVGQIETVHNVARIFLRDEFRDHYPNGTVVFGAVPSGCPDNKNCHFNAALEPYGLPMGFNTQTIFNQDISLVATRKLNEGGDVVVNGYIKLSRGDLTDSNLEWAQLLRMLGFYASGNNSNINESTEIHITVPVEEPYTDVVLRRETDENIGFLTELDMGENTIKNINNLYANKGDATKAIVYNLSLVGDANISTPTLGANVSIFYPPAGHGSSVSVLSLTNSTMNAEDAYFRGKQSEITMTGIGMVKAGNIYANVLHMSSNSDTNEFMVDDGAKGAINGNIFLRNGEVKIYNKDLSVQNLFGAYYETDDENPSGGDEAKQFGIDVRDTLYIDRLVATGSATLRAIIQDIQANKIPSADVDINFLGGVSLIPDILVVGRGAIDNTRIPFVANFLGDTATLATCSQPFTEKSWVQGGDLITNSMVYNVVCQYLFYHRLERRINHKLINKCIQSGQCN